MSNRQASAATAAKLPPVPSVRPSRPRSPGSWTRDTCPTKRGQTPNHKVGRPKGVKELTPRGSKPDLPRNSIAAIFKHFAAHRPELYANAIERGIKAGGAKSYPFIALAAAYTDGKPVERIQVVADARLLFVPAAGQLPAAAPDLGADEDDNEP